MAKVLKKKSLKKKKENTVLPKRKPEDIISELNAIKERKKDLEKREKELKKDLGVILEGEGIKDSKGSYKLIVGDFLAQKQARKSIKLDPEKAETFFKEIGIWSEVTETKEIINEDLVEQALLNEKFTTDDLEKITNTNITYAIVVSKYEPKKEEDMPLINIK